MKKIIALTMAFSLVLSLSACSGPGINVNITPSDLDDLFTADQQLIADVPEETVTHEITSTAFPMYLMGQDLGEEITLYFLDGVKDLPYVELNDWMDLLNMINTDGGESPGYELTLETNGPIATYTRETGYPMIIDFDGNTFEFVDYNYFMKLPNMSTLLDFTSSSCFNEAGEPSLMKKSDDYSFDRYGEELVLDLGAYDIDLICQDGLYLIPLQTMCDFTLAPNTSINSFFNGLAVNFTPLGISGDDELYYSAPTGMRSEELAEYGYNELCLMLDSLYGLREVHEIASFDQLFHEIGFKEHLLGRDPEDADKAIYNLINMYIDDLHSSFGAFSYLTGPIDYKAERGPSIASFIEHREIQTQARAEKYPDAVPVYEEVGNTAFITFDSFQMLASKYEDYYGYENKQDIPYEDTIAMVIKAHEQITREDSPIENVVIDLSCNVGGSVDTAAYLIAWCLGKANISLKDNFTGAMANTDYWADVNLDRKFDEKDTITDKNLYCLISPVSFSCGNLVPNVFKQSGKVTLMGRTSGGGSCVVQPISSAWGTSFNISASRRMSFLKNGSLYDIDRGADPDYTISSPAKFYDREALTDYINTLY